MFVHSLNIELAYSTWASLAVRDCVYFVLSASVCVSMNQNMHVEQNSSVWQGPLLNVGPSEEIYSCSSFAVIRWIDPLPRFQILLKCRGSKY